MGKKAKGTPNNPRWTTALWDTTDANGRPVKKGDRVFYTPRPRRIYTGPEAAEMAKIHLGKSGGTE